MTSTIGDKECSDEEQSNNRINVRSAVHAEVIEGNSYSQDELIEGPTYTNPI